MARERRAPGTLTVVDGEALSPADRAAIVALCSAAFDEDFGRMFALLPGSRHVLVRHGEALVGHACWVERWLEPAGQGTLRTAYVEAVGVPPARQGEGWGGAAMRRVAAEIAGYDLGALSPATFGFYARLGWERWRGPTAIRVAGGLLQTPDEEIMILRTPRTPPLDLDAPITAEWREGELW